jgi:hypothetical protein
MAMDLHPSASCASSASVWTRSGAAASGILGGVGRRVDGGAKPLRTRAGTSGRPLKGHVTASPRRIDDARRSHSGRTSAEQRADLTGEVDGVTSHIMSQAVGVLGAPSLGLLDEISANLTHRNVAKMDSLHGSGRIVDTSEGIIFGNRRFSMWSLACSVYILSRLGVVKSARGTANGETNRPFDCPLALRLGWRRKPNDAGPQPTSHDYPVAPFGRP